MPVDKSFYVSFGSTSTLYGREGGLLYTSLQSPHVKDIFTGVFIILSFGLSTFGAFFLRRQNMHRLNGNGSKHRLLPITHMTSWLPLQSILTYTWATKRIPGGTYGLVMVAAGLLSLIHGFFVNEYVLPWTIQYPDGCTFNYGALTIRRAGKASVPSSTLYATTTIINAQSNALANGGWAGIYDKIDQASANFHPGPNDILGYWHCDYAYPNASILFEIPSNHSSGTVGDALQDQQPDFLFYNTSSAFTTTQNSDSRALAGALSWGASEPNNSTESWSLRASVFNGNSFVDSEGRPNITNLECSLNWMSSSFEPPIMESTSTLLEWTNSVYGVLQAYNETTFPTGLALRLDVITMTSGSFGSDLWTSDDLPSGYRDTYGCVQPGTVIQWRIWILFGLMLVILVPILLIDVFIFLYDYFKYGKAPPSEQADLIDLFSKQAPTSVETWQLTLLKQAIGQTKNSDLETTDLKYFSYGWNEEKQEFELDRTDKFKNKIAGISMQPSKPSTSSMSNEKSTSKQGVECSAVSLEATELQDL